MIYITREIFEALHFCSQTLAVTHVVGRAMFVLGVIATTDVIAEMAVVQPCRTGQPRYYLVNFRIAPLAAHTSPPA